MDEVTRIDKLKENSEDLKTISKMYGLKEKGLIGKLKDMRLSTAKMLEKMEYACDLYEKTKNVIVWDDAYMSNYMLALLIGAFVLVAFLPFRYIFMTWIIYRF
jgi:hypothetical protein